MTSPIEILICMQKQEFLEEMVYISKIDPIGLMALKEQRKVLWEIFDIIEEDFRRVDK